ncbi:hypothetical protein GBAR_LOCUS17615 [Geodia barretti]|uniref:Uncharacterized protein n=1 Tax=Geodia barretti TaxID=519541 RepID=A0AA35SL21_GEOBA|nr:hypothetical protein GBAR_LOCUS17615 [Geodia barretti]
MPYIDTPFGVFVLAPAAKFNFWSWGRHSYSFCFQSVYLEVLVHDTPSCLGVPTDPDALCCEFVPHPGPVSPESRTSSFYVFAVVGDTCSNSVYSRPAATESSLIRKRLTVLSSEIVYSRPLAASESSYSCRCFLQIVYSPPVPAPAVLSSEILCYSLPSGIFR